MTVERETYAPSLLSSVVGKDQFLKLIVLFFSAKFEWGEKIGNKRKIPKT